MAKIKEVKTFVCKECVNAIENKNALYCKTRMFDVNTLSDYAKVNTVKDCIWFKEIEK